MIRKIVVPVRGDGRGENTLVHAAALARRHNAHILVTHCRPTPEDLMPYGIPMPVYVREQFMKNAETLANAEEEDLRNDLFKVATRLGLTMTEEPAFDRPSVSFVEERGKMADLVRHHGRLADVVVAAQPDPETNLGQNTLKSALYHTGRPVLMCPRNGDKRPEELGRSVAIAWNGSLEVSRAVAMTLPIIEGAERVTVLHGGQPAAHGATTGDLLSYLGLRGVTAELRQFDAKRKIARTLLEETEASGADLLIMGAYGDSHEREVLFGGNTQTIVETAQMPILMVH